MSTRLHVAAAPLAISAVARESTAGQLGFRRRNGSASPAREPATVTPARRMSPSTRLVSDSTAGTIVRIAVLFVIWHGFVQIVANAPAPVHLCRLTDTVRSAPGASVKSTA